MTVIQNFVLLLKAQKSDDNVKDKYEVILEEQGYIVKQVNTLDFEYLNLEQYKIELDKPAEFSGIIFSSPRCVAATALALNGSELDNSWQHKVNYVVGETTQEQAMKVLGLQCEGQDTGNANNLADIMLNVVPKYESPFLFPHGNLNSDILKGRLNGEIALHEVCVYKTLDNPQLHEEMSQVTDGFTAVPQFIVFFSPSGVRGAMQSLHKMSLEHIKLIAIGPTTEEAMKAHHLPVFGAADRPTCDDLIQVMQR